MDTPDWRGTPGSVPESHATLSQWPPRVLLMYERALNLKDKTTILVDLAVEIRDETAQLRNDISKYMEDHK